MQRKNKWTSISFSIKILRKSKCQVSLAVKYTMQTAKTKALISFADYREADFANAKHRFSHDGAHITVNKIN